MKYFVLNINQNVYSERPIVQMEVDYHNEYEPKFDTFEEAQAELEKQCDKRIEELQTEIEYLKIVPSLPVK